MDNDNDDRDARAAELEMRDVFARATDCSVAGCDGTWHESLEDPAGWTHRVEHVNVPALGGGWDLYVQDGRAHLGFTIQADGELDGRDARELAGQMEAASAALRTLADELEQRNAQ